MSRWVHELLRCQAQYDTVILVTVASTRGSAPRDAGTRMVVATDSFRGTIGGGHLERRAIGIAREMLSTRHAASLQRFSLGASLGQCCGGSVNLLFQPVTGTDSWVKELAGELAAGNACVLRTALHEQQLARMAISPGSGSGGPCWQVGGELTSITANHPQDGMPATLRCDDGGEYLVETVVPGRFHLFLFGAGHVGRALIKILGELECTVTWIDSREAEFPSGIPSNVSVQVADEPAGEVAHALPGCYFVVMTHNHALDQAIAEALFRRNDFAYFGLIGSNAKRSIFERRLLAKGVEPAKLARMICPIGDLTIESKEPMAIALGVAAQLQRHYEAAASCRREHSNGIAMGQQTQALARFPGHFGPASRASA